MTDSFEAYLAEQLVREASHKVRGSGGGHGLPEAIRKALREVAVKSDLNDEIRNVMCIDVPVKAGAVTVQVPIHVLVDGITSALCNELTRLAIKKAIRGIAKGAINQ